MQVLFNGSRRVNAPIQFEPTPTAPPQPKAASVWETIAHYRSWTHTAEEKALADLLGCSLTVAREILDADPHALDDALWERDQARRAVAGGLGEGTFADELAATASAH